MADEQDKNEGAPPKRRLPMKMIVVLVVVMVVEGALFGAGFMLFADKPPAAEAEGLKDDPDAAEFEPVEVLLIGDKFQNTRQGAQAYLYDATIYLVVQKQHQAFIEGEIEANMARISGEITEVFARAEPAQLNEPDRLTLKRQIKAKCDERFGEDAEGKPYVRDVVISNWKRFSADM